MSATWLSSAYPSSWSANRVVAAGMPGVTTGDPACSHPASPDETVALDCLLRVAGACWFVATAGRQPAEDDAVEPDEADADPSRHPCHLVAEPSRTPPRRRSR